MASPGANVFSALSLATYMEASITKEASPQLKTPYDAIALASHAAMLAVGFRLVGLGEDHKLDMSSDTEQPRSLPTEWNASPSSVSFRYKHTQSSMEFLLKINRMGNKAVIMGMALGDDRTTSFDVRINDYISESSLPATPVKKEQSSEEARKAMIDIFISNGRLSDLGALLRLHVIQKLLPSLHKEGYEETREETPTAQSNARQPERPQRSPLADEPQPARPHPLHDPLAQPRRPAPTGEFAPPGFEDEYDMNRPFRPPGGGPGFGNIGHRDLYPQGLGPNDPFRGMPGIGGPGGGGGMHPTFDDPLFQGQGGGQRGGFGYDPQAPPGSRYDRVGPGGAPRGSGGGGFPGQGRGGFPGQGGMGGRPPNPFGGFGGDDFI